MPQMIGVFTSPVKATRYRLPVDGGSGALAPRSRRASGQKLKVTLNRASRGAAIAVGVSHDAPLVAYSYVCW